MTRSVENSTPSPDFDNKSIIFPTANEITSVNNTTASGENELCPEGWTGIGEACYQFVTEE